MRSHPYSRATPVCLSTAPSWPKKKVLETCFPLANTLMRLDGNKDKFGVSLKDRDKGPRGRRHVLQWTYNDTGKKRRVLPVQQPFFFLGKNRNMHVAQELLYNINTLMGKWDYLRPAGMPSRETKGGRERRRQAWRQWESLAGLRAWINLEAWGSLVERERAEN